MRVTTASPAGPTIGTLGVTEDTYGVRKRIDFFLEILDEIGQSRPDPLAILDVGCGTGELVTLPLAVRGLHVVGLDVDEGSIAHAASRAVELGLDRASFHCLTLPEFLKRDGRHFDVVICSEVLEHVADPADLLRHAHAALNDWGILLVTIPNGLGPFEVQMLAWVLLERVGVLGMFRTVRQRIFPARSNGAGAAGTLATDSPHLHFFAFGDIQGLLEETGFAVSRVRNRTFLCGPFADRGYQLAARLGLGPWLLKLNNAWADRLPRHWVSDWMIVARRTPTPSSGRVRQSRSYVARLWVKVKRRAHGVEA